MYELVDGLISILGGIYGYLAATGKVKVSKNEERQLSGGRSTAAHSKSLLRFSCCLAYSDLVRCFLDDSRACWCE